jgi:hypothetical protein
VNPTDSISSALTVILLDADADAGASEAPASVLHPLPEPQS